MTDILEKLYAVPETGADPELIDEAAAEIERLRAELDAAPELLEALKLILSEREWINSGQASDAETLESRINAWVDTARAAIAKATGETE